MARFTNRGISFKRMAMSGTLEIGMRERRGKERIDPALIQNIARDEDPEREISELRRPQEGSQFLLAATRVGALPVLGPGGKVLIHESGAEPMADIIIRRREPEKLVSQRWNDLNLIYRSLAAEFEVYAEALEVRPSFGYFELSKYDRQVILRPVVAFLIGLRTLDDGQILWQTVRVQPATLHESVVEREGLEGVE